MSEESPTLGEVLRRLEALGGQLVALTAEIRMDRLAADQMFVKKETYNEARQADDRRFAELEKDNENQGNFRRQMLAGIAILFISVLVGIMLTLSGLQGGA